MDSPIEINPERSLEYIWKHSKAYAKAKAERIYLEEYRKSLKSILMKRALAEGFEAANAQEREAYANSDYKALLEGLRTAIEAEEAIRWGLVAAEAAIDIYRTQSANNRTLEKVGL